MPLLLFNKLSLRKHITLLTFSTLTLSVFPTLPTLHSLPTQLPLQCSPYLSHSCCSILSTFPIPPPLHSLLIQLPLYNSTYPPYFPYTTLPISPNSLYTPSHTHPIILFPTHPHILTQTSKPPERHVHLPWTYKIQPPVHLYSLDLKGVVYCDRFGVHVTT